MKKLITLLIYLITFSTSIVAEVNKIKILTILPLTGEIAVLGDAVRNGITMAKISSKEIELYFEDDAGLPKNTVSAIQKYLSTNRPNVVITASSGTSKAIAPLLEKEQIPLIAIATDEEISKNRKYVVNFWVTPDEEAKVLVGEALRRNYKNIAIFSTIHEGPLSIKRKFIAENNNQLAIIHDEDLTPDTKDFRSILTKFKSKIKNQEIDAIFTNVFFGQVGIFARQLRELGIKQDLF
jgi:ABC-type branched-subunit amino acid transport system substrate-binding protein